MSKGIRKKPHSGSYKFRVAVAALKGDKTVAQLCQEFGVVSSQVHKWKSTLLEGGPCVFDPGVSKNGSQEEEIEKLHATIGRLKVENDFLGRVLGKSR